MPPGTVREDGTIVYTGPKESLDDVEIEDGKRDVINREIEKFRKMMEIREAEKEKEKEAEKKRTEDREGSGRKTKEGSRDKSSRDREVFTVNKPQ